jgi:hypothetical protein
VCSTTPAHGEIAGSSDRLYGNECCRALLYGAIAGIRHPQRLAVSGHVRLRRLGTESSPDSLLEGTGFKLPVPREIRFGFRGLVVCPPFRRGGLIDIAESPNSGAIGATISIVEAPSPDSRSSFPQSRRARGKIESVSLYVVSLNKPPRRVERRFAARIFSTAIDGGLLLPGHLRLCRSMRIINSS